MKKRRRPQLRACTICHKPGHNKARCPIFLATQKTEEAPKKSAIKMVLYEKKQAIRSPYVVDLKQNNNPWSEIATFSPENSQAQELETKQKITKEVIIATKVNLKPKKDFLRNYIFSRIDSWQEGRKAAKEMARMERAMKKNQVETAKAPIAEKILREESIEKTNITVKNKTINESVDKITPEPIIDLTIFDIDDSAENIASNKIKTEPTLPLKNLIFKLSWRTAVFLFICIIPFQAHSYYQSVKITTSEIAAEGTQGFMALQESTAAILSADIMSAEHSVAEALKKFENAIQAIQDNHRLLQKIVSAVPILSNEVQSRQKLITAGQKIALGNQYLIQGISESQTNNNETLTQRIKILTQFLEAATPNYNDALEDLSSVDEKVLPFEYQAAFKDFRILFAAVLDDLNNIIDLGKVVDEIFGGNGYRRYLVVFQNPHEIRPSGGFLGSFALIDIKDGKIVGLNIPPGGSYDLQGQLDVSVEPPVPLLLTNRRWEFQDANWFADFPTSAEKMLWFYRHARQITADGVLAINATVLERLIAILGPITDETRSITLTSSTAITQIQHIVEEGPEKADNRPKQIITDLAPQIISYIFSASPSKTMPLMVNLAEALEGKEVQAYFTDKETEDTIKSFGWSGQILPIKPEQDYLMVVNTNIQGQKSDAQIKQTINHEVVVTDDGSIIDTVVITREHTGDPSQKLYGSTNINYIRVYVPKGSELINAGGFTWPDERKFRAPLTGSVKDEFLLAIEKEIRIDAQSGTRITEEFGKTAFGNWLILEPGETRQVQFTYQLPFRLKLDEPSQNPENNLFRKIINENYFTSRYQLVVQKQSGVKSSFESQIIYPAPWHPNWTDGNNTTLASNGIAIGPIDLNKDEIWSLLMRKDNN